jgi:hypothetical protein
MREEKGDPTSLAPVKDAIWPGHWVVYVKRTPSDHFVIYVDKKYNRQFPLKDLPTEIKEKLVLIHSIDSKAFEVVDIPEVLEDVGWRLDDTWYQFVISEKLLNELRGMPLTNGIYRKAENDTGRTSKETSEGDSQ